MSEKTTIEINGVKMEVDLRYARRVEEIRVGDKVKVLTKDYSGHRVSPGVVVGFEPFQKLPTIVVAYVEADWSSAKIKFLHYNTDSKDVEIVAAADELGADKEAILSMFDKEAAAKQRELDEIAEKRRYFETNFRAYWERIEAPVSSEGAAA